MIAFADRTPLFLTRFSKVSFQVFAKQDSASVELRLKGRNGDCRTSAIMGHIWEVENPRV